MKLKRSVLKLLIFITVLVAIVFAIKMITPQDKPVNRMTAALDEKEAVQETSYYFIGSSRVMRGIDPKVIQSYFHSDRVYNMGISSATFLNNCMLAEYVIRKSGRKFLFIELSPRKLTIPPTFLGALHNSDFNPLSSEQKLFENLSIADRFYLMTDASNYLFSRVSLNAEFKSITGTKEPTNTLAGFKPYDGNNFAGTSSFLTYNDIVKQREDFDELNGYLDLIQYLVELGKTHNTKLVFFLPVTSKNKEERDLIVPVFNSLPDSLKLIYTEGFLEAISKPEYLMDKNHFNRKGAETYSRMLCPLLEHFFVRANKN